MCGILGGNKKNWNYENAIESLNHRGPDKQRIIRMERFTLGFSRLAIIDLSDNAMQPMFSEDGNIGIVFNGEIYGFNKVRNHLLKLGYKFHSNSDTEVILKAYLEWGEKFINKIDGMFSIAIYDKVEEKLKIFRDRVGIKPLYYHYNGHDFCFASELKGIVAMCCDRSFDIDNTALYDYLNYSYIPDPKTMYKKVYKLPPAHKLIFNVKNRKIEKIEEYWKLKINTSQGKQRRETDLIDELKSLIKRSVKEQLVADVPVGTFLSGGVDSSIVTLEANTINNNTEAFSIGFDEKLYDELKYANYLAEKFNIPINQKIFNKEIYKSLYFRLQEWYDEPFADNSAFPTYLVSELAKKKVTVVLTGDGGDEIFGGYPRYTEYKKNYYKKGLNSKGISKIFEYLNSNNLLAGFDKLFMEDLALLHFTYQSEVRPDKKKLRKILRVPDDYDDYWYMRQFFIEDLPPITRCQYIDFKTYLPGDILTKVDRASMAVSLETRVPLLSKKIIEFSFSLSEEDRCPNNELKGLLKKAYLNEIGKTFLYRSKKGFSVPARYMQKGISPQEELLHNVWRL